MDYTILTEAPVLDSKTINATASAKVLALAKIRQDKLLRTGKWRKFQGSTDAKLVEKTIKNRSFIKNIMIVLGSVVVTNAIFNGDFSTEEAEVDEVKELNEELKSYSSIVNYMDACSELLIEDLLNEETTVLANTVGIAVGYSIVKRISGNLKYSMFEHDGMTILSIYSSKKETKGKGKSLCFIVLTKYNGKKLHLDRVKLKGYKN